MFEEVPQFQEAYTFDDVLLLPRESSITPKDTNIQSHFTRTITLNIPLVSAAMDTVTESPLAIALAQEGGIGVIHSNMSIERQVREVENVKRFESWMVSKPITIVPEAPLSHAVQLMEQHHISGIPVVQTDEHHKNYLVGILTNRDIRFAFDLSQRVSERMTKDNLITVPEDVDQDEAKKLLHQHRIEKLIVVDNEYRCIGLITYKDIVQAERYPQACKDSKGRLRVAAAIGPYEMERAAALTEVGADALVIDTAHGHSQRVIDMIRSLRQLSNEVQVIAGNVVTSEGAQALIQAGADAIKVGIGPGSICTTRIVVGVGVPQLSAILEVQRVCRTAQVPLIADGGMKYSGDIAKAIAAGASSTMLGALFAGTDESAGEQTFYKGRSYKKYRGMGSVGAYALQRYALDGDDKRGATKFVPEGVEGRVSSKGPVSNVVYQLVGGLRAAMGYTGSTNIEEFQKNARFLRITNASLRESHVHDIQITNEAPNYVPNT